MTIAVIMCRLFVQQGIAQTNGSLKDEELRKALRTIAKVYAVSSTQLADPVDSERAIYDGAIRGALARLDPFSTFLDSGQVQSMQEQQKGVQKGFGAILNVQAGAITVLQSIPGSPFGRAGLGPGDRIVRVNDRRVASLDLQELVEVLQQAKYGPVRLSVLQSGKVVPTEFVLSPAEVESPTVDKKFLVAPSTGYIHLARVEEKTPEELKEAIESWSDGKINGLVLDLRDNPGGLLDQAVAVCSLFLRQGQAVVSLQGRAVAEKKYSATGVPRWNELPLVVITNGRTASAGEIIAAALQEHDRAWIVGEASFGKGVVETVMPLSQGAALALTTARYYTPNGRSVQRSIPGSSLESSVVDNRPYRSDSGRPLKSRGGVSPDRPAKSWVLDPWAEFVGQSTAIVNFGQLYIERHGKVTDSFEIDASVLEEFQNYLRQSGVVVPTRSWNASIPYFKVRILTEIFNLSMGSSKGDEVEIKGDPQVVSALESLRQAKDLLGDSSEKRVAQLTDIR